ncbi:MAG: YraN family protein [Bdellovibrio sp.]
MAGHVSGRLAEQKVAQALTSYGCHVLARNLVIVGVEIDVLAEKDGIMHVIEVKTMNQLEYLERRVTPAQVIRIRRVLRLFLERGQPARAHLVLVLPDRLKILSDFFVSS